MHTLLGVDEAVNQGDFRSAVVVLRCAVQDHATSVLGLLVTLCQGRNARTYGHTRLSR